MSYITAIQPTHNDKHSKNCSVLVWERDETGNRTTADYHAPFYFYISDPDGEYTTIYDTKVSKIDCGSDRSMYYRKRKEYKEKGVKLWESDISPELRVLSEQYFGLPAPNLHVTHLDIENDYDRVRGYSGPKNPYAPINAISLFHEHLNEMVAIAVPPDDGRLWTNESLELACNERVPLPVGEYKITFKVCKNERELLEEFLTQIEDSDMLVGWNSTKFDFPFIGKRVEIVLGIGGLRRLSFPGGNGTSFVDVEDINKFRPKQPGVEPQTYIALETSGRLLADYMVLYRKYEASEKPSYKLSSISDEVLVDDDGNSLLPKLEYEKSLYDLYRDDFPYFVRYNIRDCEILHGFEKKLGYVRVANTMYHLSCGLFAHVPGTLKLAELAIVNHCHHELKKVVNNITEPAVDKQIEGALVLLPQIGEHRMVGAIDITSLYPSDIRSINISPEKIRGQFLETHLAQFEIMRNSDVELCMILESTQEEITAPASEWREFLLANKWAISGYGTAFDQDEQGIIPAVLTSWFVERKRYQALKKKAESEGDYEAAEYNDRLQYVYKIKLNSLYGALSNLYFRFYDLRMGESTTSTGRLILRHQCRMVNKILEGKYDIDIPMYDTVKKALEHGQSPDVALHGPVFNGQFQSKSVIYGDTDSVYFATGASTVEEAILIADYVAKKVNESYQAFMESAFLCQPDFSNLVKCGREVVSDRGIFVEKKRYILHLVDVEGKKVDKCKVMGLDTKKTTLPSAVSKELNRFIERYLKGEDWRSVSTSIVEYKNKLQRSSNVMEIGLPKGVNNIEEYTNSWKLNPATRLPGNVAAAINYNTKLIEFEDMISLPIMSGMKIKVFYLKTKMGRFKSIALPTDLEVVPDWFYESVNIDMDAHITRLVDNPLQNILKAIDKRPPSKSSLVFEDEWEF